MPAKQVAAIYRNTLKSKNWALNDNNIFVKVEPKEEFHQMTIWEYFN